jgi:hypothetical protein
MWRELNSKLLDVVLVDEDDVVQWAFEKSGQFTAKSLHRFLSRGGGGGDERNLEDQTSS